MVQIVNIPIQLISSCSTLGEFTPLRFRYVVPESHDIMTIKIDEVISQKENHFNGAKEFLFTCSACFQNEKKLFDLRYSVITHKWSIFQMLN